MAFTTVHNGIVISEGRLNYISSRGSIVCNKTGIGAQLKSLKNVKDDLCFQAKLLGANAIMDFTYGQKSTWFSWDNVAFYGKGVAVTISKEEYDSILAKDDR